MGLVGEFAVVTRKKLDAIKKFKGSISGGKIKSIRIASKTYKKRNIRPKFRNRRIWVIRYTT